MGLARKLATVVTLAMLGTLIGVTAARAGGGGHCEATEGNGTTIELSGACFTPTTSYVEPGDTIVFVNRDPFAHNVSGSGWGHYEDMAEGDRYSTSFQDEGVYAFACTLHPGMTGSIIVGGDDVLGAVPNAEPLAASAVPAPAGDGWLLPGALGLVIGAAAGVGITRLRRSPAAS